MKNLQPTTYQFSPKKLQAKKLLQSGFTLVETLVSISVFMVVMTVAAGSILSIIDGNGKAQSIKSAVNNLNFAIESMAKEIRMGNNYNYTCVSNPCEDISFVSKTGKYVTYKKDGELIKRCVRTGSICPTSDTFVQMTAGEVKIESLKFYIFNTLEPKRVLVTISGIAGTKVKLQTTFNLQTTVSQRSF